jgi:hypothetical protein
MKAQHRHQLQTNALAEGMGRLVKGLKASPKNTSILVWVFLILALATYIFWQYQVSASQTTRSAQWVEVDTDLRDGSQGDGGTSKLASFGDDNAGSIAGRTALFAVARHLYQEGQNHILALFQNERKQAVENLVNARTLYKRLANECLDSAALAQEALMGVAKIDETLSAVHDPKAEDKSILLGSLDDALKSYRQVVDKDAGSPLGRDAAKRIEELEDASTRKKVEEFYAEMSKAINEPISLPPLPEPPEPKGK